MGNQSASDREALALATIRFREIDQGPDVYAAIIRIAGRPFGSVRQRRGGPYEAYGKTNRLIAVADTRTQLRERVAGVYAATTEAPVAVAVAT